MGIRDWRCYAIAYSTMPVYSAIMLGTISTVLMAGLALVWRGRSTAAAGAATIVAKLFLWPMLAAVAGLAGMRRALALVALGAVLGRRTLGDHRLRRHRAEARPCVAR